MKKSLADVDYICGAELLEEGHSLKEVMYMKPSLDFFEITICLG